MNYKYILFYFFISSHILLSQEQALVKTSSEKVNSRIEIGSSYSYSGLNGLLGVSIKIKKNEIGVGVRTSITQFSRYSSSNFVGMYLEYNRMLFTEKKLNSLINIHYGNLFRKFNSPVNNEKAWFQVHELYAGYGLSYKIQKFYIVNTINYGGYIERQKSFYKNETTTFFHVGPMIKLSIKYEL